MAYSWDDFDKAFWVSGTNIRNLIEKLIEASGNIDSLQSQVNNIQNDLSDIHGSLSDVFGDLSDVYGYLAEHTQDIIILLREIQDIKNRLTAGGL